MGRSRSRSRGRKRSRSRDRRRSRSRSRDRASRGGEGESMVAQIQALAAVQAQAQMQRQMLAQQQALLGSLPTAPVPQAAMVAAAASAAQATPASDSAARKSREIYIGNLQLGVTTGEMLEELFNVALAGFVDDPSAGPPVVIVKMDPTGQGRFAFVELRTEDLATHAMCLDNTEVCGKQMKIGRPKGYIPGPAAVAGGNTDALAAAQQVAAALLGGVTPVVLLEGLLDAAAIRSDDERQEVSEMVFEEARRCGKVLGIAVPVPAPEVADDEPCRVYVKFASSAEAGKCKEMMDGRQFDDHKIKAKHVTEIDYSRAAGGEWIQPGSLPPMPSVPGLAGMPGLAGVSTLPGPPGMPGVSGFAAMPGLAGLPSAFIPGLPGSAPLAIPNYPLPPGLR